MEVSNYDFEKKVAVVFETVAPPVIEVLFDIVVVDYSCND
jgi:hypothetical protein